MDYTGGDRGQSENVNPIGFPNLISSSGLWQRRISRGRVGKNIAPQEKLPGGLVASVSARRSYYGILQVLGLNGRAVIAPAVRD